MTGQRDQQRRWRSTRAQSSGAAYKTTPRGPAVTVDRARITITRSTFRKLLVTNNTTLSWTHLIFLQHNRGARMVLKRVVLTLVALAVWGARSEAATSPAVKFCGRQLGEIMSRVCHAYNSPSWDVPTVEQPGSSARRKRQLPGIADECCIIGCTWKQLSEYCSISAFSESPLEELEAHIIADRSAERAGEAGAANGGTRAVDSGAAPSGSGGAPVGSGFSGARTRGYGRSRPKARRCWCRRKRREGRRRSSLMGPRKNCSSRCARGRHHFAPDNVGKDSQH